MTGRAEPRWRQLLLRVLLGPMPLAYPLIGVCAALYLLSALLSVMWSDAGPEAFFTAIWTPSRDALTTLGMGGNAPIVAGQVWTLITSSYLHGSLPHIALNMVCLYQIMPMVESSFGRLRAFIIYAVAGIVGALASAIWGEPYSLGASGAIFGLFGAIIAYGGLRGDQQGRALMFNAAIWAGLNFAFGLVASGISNASHLGGFIGGVAVASGMMFRLVVPVDPRRFGFVLAGLTTVCLAIGLGGAASTTWQMTADPQAFARQREDSLLGLADDILATTPENGQAHYMRGAVYANREMYSEALTDADAAINNGYDGPESRNLRAWILYKLGRAAEGLPDVEAALKASPDTAAIIDTRAHIFEALGERDKAIADYNAALANDPSQEESRRGLARLTDGS